MPFKPFTHLPRQILSKTFAHGYAQSVVAASQSSYASTTTSLGLNSNYPVGKLGRTAQLQNAYQGASSSSGPGAKTGHAGSSNASSNDGGLAAYYSAWQHAQQTGDDSEWRDHQLQRRIGWRDHGPTRSRRESTATADAVRPHRPALSRPHSANVVHDIKEAVDEEPVVAISEGAIHSNEDTSKAEVTSNVDATSVDDVSATSLFDSTFSTDASSVTSVSEASGPTSEHIVQLAKAQQYAEIPAVFQASLSQGVVPSIDAYNALLVAAINLPADADQAFSKVLAVQADMHRRGVRSNADTYAIMVQFLAERAAQAIASGHALKESQKRYGRIHGSKSFLFTSSELEYELLAEDNSLSWALKQFRASVAAFPQHSFPADVYDSLIRACAQAHLVDDMCEVYNVMNSHFKIMSADTFGSMIEAFQPTANLGPAIQAYADYKALALASDPAFMDTRSDTSDFKVYAALIKSYILAGQEARGLAFYDEVSESLQQIAEDHPLLLGQLQAIAVPEGVIAAYTTAKAYPKALEWLKSQELSDEIANAAFAKICIEAADADKIEPALEAFGSLTSASKPEAAPAMLAMAIRLNDIDMAKSFWEHTSRSANVDRSLLQPTTAYAVALIANNSMKEGLTEARNMFSRIREQNAAATGRSTINDEIAEALLKLDQTMMGIKVLPSVTDSVVLLRAMMENGLFIPSVAEHNLAPIGPNDIQALGFDDLKFVMHVQASMMLEHSTIGDNGSLFRFADLLQSLMSTGKELDLSTVTVVKDALPLIREIRPDLSAAFEAFLRPAPPAPAVVPFSPAPAAVASPFEAIDPYAHNTDFRGSTIIADQLESSSGRSDNLLNDALARFKNMRRIGRHPRYITYAKMITAAARAGKRNVVQDILNMACTDIPYLEQYPVVKHGWVSILDSMVAAYLTVGDRAAAARVHQDLLAMGAAPSANTFGLYITTLKESTRTFDEATEAVKIFHRAVAEGVEPTSFLYNALIGKLGKARRIDDCLQYFAEMRSQNIRPTSVTYGTIVNALCRVSDERFAEEMFDEMESMPNYKPRPAPYNSLIQYFLNTKRDRTKVLAYYERMKSKHIEPTMHTYKLLIDAYASLEPVDMAAAERIIASIKASRQKPEAVHYASLIHAKGCVLQDMAGARAVFDSVLSERLIQPQPCLYQALFEAMVANHQVAETEALLKDMTSRRVEMTPYIANTLIHGWASEGNLSKAKAVYSQIGLSKREPSTYEAMARALLSHEDHHGAANVVNEMMSRGYPAAVSGKILELVGGGNTVPAAVVA